MRPQLAMAAIFFLVIGSALSLLRPRGQRAGLPVSVTEHGSPTPDTAEVAAAAAAAAATASPAAAEANAESDVPAASAAFARGRGPAGDAITEKGGGSDGKGGDAARAALADARALRDRGGCPAAVGKLDAVAVAFPGTQAASDAMWDEAACYKQMGDTARAQQLYVALRSTGYRERANEQLATESKANVQGNAVAGRAVATPTVVAAAPAAAPPPAAAKPADPGGKADADAEAHNAGPAAARPAPRSAAGAPSPRAPAAPAKKVDPSNVGF